MLNIEKILSDHRLWLADKKTGARADLNGADLNGANLIGADLSGADLSKANLRWANLSWADLREADLREANFIGADLFGAVLSGADIRWAIGNGNQIKTVQTSIWTIGYTTKVMAIGCEQHTIDDWMSFDDDRIADMSSIALVFWNKWKPIIQAMLG